jgi:hypothetical protein
MIIDAKKLPQDVTIELSENKILGQQDTTVEQMLASPSWKYLSLLKEKGLIEIKPGEPEKRRDDPFVRTIPVAFVTLTDNGRKYVSAKTRNGVQVKVCELHFGEVTGIVTTEKQATVEYTVKLANATPFAMSASQALDTAQYCSSGKVAPDRATFTLYDDGWRIDQ